MKTIPLSIAYPVWAGLGMVLVVTTGLVMFQETITTPKIIGIVLVVAGSVLLNLHGAHK